MFFAVSVKNNTTGGVIIDQSSGDDHSSQDNNRTTTIDEATIIITNSTSPNDTRTTSNNPPPKLTPDAFPVGNSPTYIGLISGVLTVIALLLTCTVFLMKQRGRNKVALLQKHTALLCGSPTPGLPINLKDIKAAANPVIVNGLSQSRLSVKSKIDEQVRIGDALPNEYEHCSAYERTYKLFSEEDLAYEPQGIKSEHHSSCKTEYSGRFGLLLLLICLFFKINNRHSRLHQREELSR